MIGYPGLDHVVTGGRGVLRAQLTCTVSPALGWPHDHPERHHEGSVTRVGSRSAELPGTARDLDFPRYQPRLTYRDHRRDRLFRRP